MHGRRALQALEQDKLALAQLVAARDLAVSGKASR
jgi:hypothetical protein